MQSTRENSGKRHTGCNDKEEFEESDQFCVKNSNANKECLTPSYSSASERILEDVIQLKLKLSVEVNKYFLFQCIKQGCWLLTHPVLGGDRKSLCCISACGPQARGRVWPSRPWCGIGHWKFYWAYMSMVASTSQSLCYKLRLKSCRPKPTLSQNALRFQLWAGTCPRVLWPCKTGHTSRQRFWCSHLLGEGGK